VNILQLVNIMVSFDDHRYVGFIVTRKQEFVQLSIQLAHEYVQLGKLREAKRVYTRSLDPTQTQAISSETRVVLLLRHAESLAKIGDVDQR
jgi:separase